ncbi:DUF4432 family protein, partial [Variovorax paradoxus]|uniref:DUF4432 family protein n=1 Tax=Variovorax paradoxus TaxID=34073 RepID=UPI001ABCAA6B
MTSAPASSSPQRTWFITGVSTGFAFQVLVDRAMDVGACEYRSAAIGWQSPTGFRHPGLHENA